MLRASKSVLFLAAGWGTGKSKDQICNELGIKSLQKVSFGIKSVELLTTFLDNCRKIASFYKWL